MGYYQGDYYQGDYYQGDPFLGGLIGAGIGWLGKKIFNRGLSKVAQAKAGSMVLGGAGRAAGVGLGVAAATGLSLPLPGNFRFNPGAFLPGGAPLISREPMFRNGVTAQAGCAPGYHPNKSKVYCGSHCGAEPGTYMVRNRTMNVANPRALRRSLRRVAGFGKLAQRAKRDVNRAARALK